MSEKMRCARCGKRFKQSSKNQILCGECLGKEKAARKNAPQLVPASVRLASRPTSTTDASQQTPGITIVQAAPPPEVRDYGARARAGERNTRNAPETPGRQPSEQADAKPGAGEARSAISPDAPAVVSSLPAKPTPAAQPTSKARQGEKGEKSEKSENGQKRERQQRPPVAAFELTDDMRASIEQTYLDMSQPVEYDGIRTAIANQLSVPKPIVKQVINALRRSRQLPSWWELQAFKGSPEDLERVRERYVPMLPTPPIGAHKQIAQELQIDAPQVYQAIRRVRAEMKLPQYNPPQVHADELASAENAESDPGTAAALPESSESAHLEME